VPLLLRAVRASVSFFVKHTVENQTRATGDAGLETVSFPVKHTDERETGQLSDVGPEMTQV